MANKNVLFGGRVIKVENRSGFDKSRLNALTTGVGTITPILKQLVIPSSGRVSVAIHAELPPLATNAFLRTRLKLEAFFVPMRLCYGGFQSWFAGEEIHDPYSNTFTRAELPYGFIPEQLMSYSGGQYTGTNYPLDQGDINEFFGPGSLSDYFNVKFYLDNQQNVNINSSEFFIAGGSGGYNVGRYHGCKVNIFPYLAYHLIYHHYYRNKSVQRPLFCPPDMGNQRTVSTVASHLPFISDSVKRPVLLGSQALYNANGDSAYSMVGQGVAYSDQLLDGYSLCQLRQRNYGDDYFTAARPTAQAGNPVQVQTDANGRFTIASIRLQNAMQEFAENQGYATPDYVQTNAARYGVDISGGIVQKPILLGSADFPMFTKGVEMTMQGDDNFTATDNRNPFASVGILGSQAGRASANGSEFVCDFDVKEAGYIIVNATLVPEANYSSGISRDMRIFINSGDLTDLPCGLLEHVGDEPIFEYELHSNVGNISSVFGFVQRYLWHKAGGENEVHGLYRQGKSLQAFVPQRSFGGTTQISSSFLLIPRTALDGVAAVADGVSDFGVMLDCAIKMSVSEPLSESALPALSNPAIEHGRSVYLKNGGSKLA